MSADTKPLPVLFRWQPGMRRECRAELIIDIAQHSDGVVLWFANHRADGDRRLREPAQECRPDMSHAGTRGLVLEQVREAVGDPGVHPRMVFDPASGRWMWRIDWNDWQETEGAALLDALDRAGTKR